MELLDGARIAVTECLNIKPLEKVLIVTDKKMLRFGKLLFKASREVNLETVMVVMETRNRDGEEPPEIIAQAMKNSDVIIAITYYSLTHTKARREACASGARVATMPRIRKFSFVQGGLTADYTKVKELTGKVHSLVENSSFVEVKSKNGTDVHFSVRGRKWFKDIGFIHNSGEYGNLPGGEVFIAPSEDSINGKIVFDSFELANGRVKLTVENGMVKEVEGRAKKLLKVFDELGEKAKVIAEFGIGTNPKAKIIGNGLEDEKVMGTIHFALGNNVGFGGSNEVAFHKDGIIVKPTVKVDNKTIVRNGKFLFPR